MFKYGVITDEISQDIEVAASLAEKYGLSGLEIRSVNDRAPHELTDEDVAEIKAALKRHGLVCCGISSPVFKCNLKEEEIKESIEILKSCIRLAKALGTKFIRGFTFFKEKPLSDAICDIVKAYQSVIPMLEENDVYILLESDPSVYASCGESLAMVLKAIDSERVKGLWDPGNDIYSPEREIPYPDGYSHMRNMVSHVHIKDAVRNGENVDGVPFGKGDVDFKGQLSALKEDGYDGYLVMETHYRPKAAISEELLLLPKGEAFSLGGYEATEECLQNFLAMMKEI